MVRLRSVLRDLTVAMLLLGVYCFYQKGPCTTRTLSDASAITGLVYLCIGLFRLTRHMGFFDSTIYGTRRLWEIITAPQRASTEQSKHGSFIAYKEQNAYARPYTSMLLTAAFLLSFSLITALGGRH